MKTKILLLALAVLFSSCYTYKGIDPASERPVVGTRYKIKTDDSRQFEGIAVDANDSLIVLKNKNGIEVPVPISRIKEVRQIEFSLWKTIGLSVGGAATVGLVVATKLFVDDLESLGQGWFTYEGNP